MPVQPWGKILFAVTAFVVVATGLWEWRMRALELLPGDLEDGPSYWAEERRRIDTEEVSVAIIGDSRILFDTDLQRFEALTGVRPVQLALPGTNARPFLEDLAADADFKGLAIVGLAEGSYFRKDRGLLGHALDRYHFESPAERSSYVLDKGLSRVFGFVEPEYRLSRLAKRLDRGVRPGAESPYDDVWKLSSRTDFRQTSLWTRIERDAYLNAHARSVWRRQHKLPPVSDEMIAATQKATREAVAAIRARGGEVIFVRPPSTGEYWANEERRLPRARGWDALLAAAGAIGFHADDDPVTRDLDLPELSHLSRACATVYTDAYVRSIATTTSRFTLRPDAPPALTARDCPKGVLLASMPRQVTRVSTLEAAMSHDRRHQ